MARAPDWKRLLEGWDAQQEAFNPDRDRRFSAMFDALAASVPRRFVALDLGSGPGSLSVRLLQRFPSARVVAVDYDPVTQRVGQGALGDFGGRLAWVDAKLGAPGWTDHLPRAKFDAALSTTALHWLSAEALRRLFRDLHRILRPGAVVLDGDHFPWGPHDRALARLDEGVRRVRFRGIAMSREWSAWRGWWKAAERIPALRPYFREHRRRSAQHPRHADLTLDVYIDALRRAGFRDVGVVWQDFTNRVVFARR